MKHALIVMAIFAVICANAQTPAVGFDPISVTSITTGYWVDYMGPVDNAGNIYIANNNSVKRINPNGTITLLAGTGVAGLVDGPGTTAQFNGPQGLALDAAGNIYVGDKNNNAIRKITPAGMVSTVAGNGTPGYANASGVDARFNLPTAVVTDVAGNIFVSDNGNYAIRKITQAGVVSTVTIDAGYPLGPIVDVRDMAIDQLGNLYITQIDYGFLKITPAGVVSGVQPPSFPGFKQGVATDRLNNLYVPVSYGTGNTDIIFKIFPANVPVALAGSGIGYKDGTGTDAMFNSAQRITVDPSGDNIYVSDANGIRKMSKPILNFTTTAGVASAAKYFTISGNYLTGPASLQAPAGYELSLNQAGPYSSTVSLLSTTGEIHAVQIFIRLAAANAAATYNGVVVLSASGASTRNLAVSGVVSPAGGNQAPASNAGSNVTTVLPVSSLPLDGSASYDPDGSIAQYYWYQAQGPVQAVIGDNFSSVTTATGLTTAGTYIFGLQVKDNAGILAYAYKTVVVNPISTIPVPGCVYAVSPAPESTLTTQTTATLTWGASYGATSYDVYLWKEGETPPATPANTTALTYSATGLTASTRYKWNIVPRNESGPATNCAVSFLSRFITAAATAGNQPPVPIIAGNNASITLPADSLLLDGYWSYDPDGYIVQFYWSQVQGPVPAVIDNNLWSFATARGLTTAGTYVFGLQVKDNIGVLGYAYKTVVVNPVGIITFPACIINTSPANASTIGTQTTATLTWPASPTATSYDVYLAAGTGTPMLRVLNTTMLTYNATGLTAGTLYSWYIAPRNENGAATTCAAANKTMFTTAAAGNPPTVSNAGSNVTITLPTNFVTLDGRASTGNIVQYYWYQAQGPAQAVIGNQFSSLTTATGLTTAGTYVFGLQVKDNTGVPVYSYKTVTVNASGARVMDASVQTTASLKTYEGSSLPSISAVISPNPVVTGQQAKLQINSNKAGTVMVNIVGSNGAIISNKKLNLVAGINRTTVNTYGLAQGFHVIRITGSDKPLNLKLVIQ